MRTCGDPLSCLVWYARSSPALAKYHRRRHTHTWPSQQGLKHPRTRTDWLAGPRLILSDLPPSFLMYHPPAHRTFIDILVLQHPCFLTVTSLLSLLGPCAQLCAPRIGPSVPCLALPYLALPCLALSRLALPALAWRSVCRPTIAAAADGRTDRERADAMPCCASCGGGLVLSDAAAHSRARSHDDELAAAAPGAARPHTRG